MSTAPIDRDTQIELMKTYGERRAMLLKTVTSDPAIKRALMRNALLEGERSDYTRSDTRVKMCG